MRGDSYWRPRLMRHSKPSGGYEYAIHDVYFFGDGAIRGYTREARSPSFHTPAAAREWIEAALGTGQPVRCGHHNHLHSLEDLARWLPHLDDPPLDWTE